MFDLKKIDIGLSVDWNDNSTSLSFHHEKKKPEKIKVLTLIENKTCDEEPQEMMDRVFKTMEDDPRFEVTKF